MIDDLVEIPSHSINAPLLNFQFHILLHLFYSLGQRALHLNTTQCLLCEEHHRINIRTRWRFCLVLQTFPQRMMMVRPCKGLAYSLIAGTANFRWKLSVRTPNQSSVLLAVSSNCDVMRMEALILPSIYTELKYNPVYKILIKQFSLTPMPPFLTKWKNIKMESTKSIYGTLQWQILCHYVK